MNLFFLISRFGVYISLNPLYRSTGYKEQAQGIHNSLQQWGSGIYFKVWVLSHTRFSKQSKSRTVSKTAFIKHRQMQHISYSSHSIYKLPAHTPHIPHCLNYYPLQGLLTSLFMSMTQSKHYLSQNCTKDRHIHSETKSSFCSQYPPLTAVKIMRENIWEKQTVNHALKVRSLEPDSWYSVTATLA